MVENLGLKKKLNYTLRLQFLWFCEISGNFVKIDILSIAESQCWKIILYIMVLIPMAHFLFLLINFKLNTDFPSEFEFFSAKSLSITKHWFFKKVLLKIVKMHRLYFNHSRILSVWILIFQNNRKFLSWCTFSWTLPSNRLKTRLNQYYLSLFYWK